MKISVIVPAYNVSDYIETCVQSILTQTYSDIEVIIVDDGSTDGTSRLCDSIADSDSRVVVYHKANGGVSSARNMGIKHAKGDYVMFVDGDDWLDRTCIYDMMQRIKENKSDACSCNKYFKNNTIQVATSIYSDKALPASDVLKKHLSYGFIASPCLTIWKRACVRDVLFNETIHTLEDWEYNFRCLARVSNICILDKAYYHYRTVNGSASVSHLNSRKLTSLNSPECINNYILDNHLELDDEAKYVPVFIVYQMLVIYSTQGAVDSAEIKLRDFARKTLRQAIFNKMIKPKHKIYLVLGSIHPALFKVIYKYKNRI